MEFFETENARFPCLELARKAAETGGTAPTVLCAADEIAVELFLKGKIGFLDIPRLIARALESHASTRVESLDHVLAVAVETRQRLLEDSTTTSATPVKAGIQEGGQDGFPLSRE